MIKFIYSLFSFPFIITFCLNAFSLESLNNTVIIDDRNDGAHSVSLSQPLQSKKLITQYISSSSKTKNIKRNLTVSQMLKDNTMLYKGFVVSEIASETLESLKVYEEAFNNFDKSTGYFNGAGTFIAKNAPAFLKNLLYSRKAQSAIDVIDYMRAKIFRLEMYSRFIEQQDFVIEDLDESELNYLSDEANKAIKELKLLQHLSIAFDDFDKNTGRFNGAGSFVSRYAPALLDNFIYNEKAQAAKQIIEYINNKIQLNKINQSYDAFSQFALEEVLKESLTPKITLEARKTLINLEIKNNKRKTLQRKLAKKE